MKIEKLRNNHKKEIIIGTILTIVIGGALTFRLTHSKYRVTQSIDLASGVINYTAPDFKIMAIKISDDGETYNDTNTIPTSGYVLNKEKSSCKISNAENNNISLNYHDGVIGIDNIVEKGTKCYLYFDKGKTVDNIITNLNAKSSTPDFSKISTTDEGVFKVNEGTNMYNGTTYYWRGAATTNHVIFAGFCWRIIRINGDKTIRLIYNGSINESNTCKGNGSNKDSHIQQSITAYSPTYNASYYVGWTYVVGQRPSLNVNSNTGLTEDGYASNAKTQMERWYNNNIGNYSIYSSKVANGKFCNDRDTESGGSSGWSAKGYTFNYAGYKRLYTNKAPTFNCPNGDVYTLKVGAITADEVAFAGGVYGTNNTTFYLYNELDYWTMSPFYWGADEYANIFYVNSSGRLNDYSVHSNTPVLRPVINLKSDITFSSGNGTQNQPYIVS